MQNMRNFEMKFCFANLFVALIKMCVYFNFLLWFYYPVIRRTIQASIHIFFYSQAYLMNALCTGIFGECVEWKQENDNTSLKFEIDPF